MENSSIQVSAKTGDDFMEVSSPVPSPNRSFSYGQGCSDLEQAFHDEESVVSDGESVHSGDNFDQFPEFSNGMVRLSEENKLNDLIKRIFLFGLGSLGKETTVVAIHRKTYSDVINQAKIHSFNMLSKAVEEKHRGNPCVRFGWFGPSSEEQICNIMIHGFGHQINDNDGMYGCGIYLSSEYASLESVMKLKVGNNGLRHVLFCRVILGKPEVVRPGSDQNSPSSEEFDSGIDASISPKKYIIWSTHMNTHILPEFVVTFKAPSNLEGYYSESLRVPKSPWMPFPALIAALSKFFPPSIFAQIDKYHKDYQGQKISRQELIRQLRTIAGDSLLIHVIKSYGNNEDQAGKQHEATMAATEGLETCTKP